MDRKKGFLNVFFSLFFKIIIMILALYSRKYIIKYLGNELNGLSSLYSSVVGVLCVVELGIGSAITFSMYKPIIENDKKKVNALYVLYKKLYGIVGIIILTIGLIIVPFLPTIANSYTVNSLDLYGGYLLYLFSIVMTYFYSAKISLINAYKNNYITSITTSIGQILLYILQIFSLIIFKSFIVFNFVRITTNFITYLFLTLYVRKNHFDVIYEKNQIGSEEKIIINKNIRAMFYHKIGAELVNTSDNIIISVFLGIEILGYYSNYSSLAVSLMALLNLIFTSLTSIIGHYYASKDNKEIEKYYRFFHTLNFLVGVVFFLGYYSIIDLFINLFYDENGVGLLLERKVVLVITINYFVQYFRKATLMFKDATGTFYNDRYVPILEGIVNIIISILFVKMFGIFGIILATIITNLLICYIFEPIIIYKYAFKMKSSKFIFKNYFYTFIFIFVITLFDKFNIINKTGDIMNLFLNGIFSICISIILIVFVIITDKNFRCFIFKKIKRIKKGVEE